MNVNAFKQLLIIQTYVKLPIMTPKIARKCVLCLLTIVSCVYFYRTVHAVLIV